jgi:hypothetical protein
VLTELSGATANEEDLVLDLRLAVHFGEVEGVDDSQRSPLR